MKRATILIAVALALVTGCAEVASPDELEHTRVLAVRADPPGILAEGISRIDVLATTDLGELVRPIASSAFGSAMMWARLPSARSAWMLTVVAARRTRSASSTSRHVSPAASARTSSGTRPAQ